MGVTKQGSSQSPVALVRKCSVSVNLKYPEETEIIPCRCRGAVMKLNQMLQLLFGFGKWSYTSLFTCIINSFL